ncbi:sugar ABC transporter ATP-binding protein [bacterium]|nr:MAG: sugar ABC transporter ATP-binding protein [bacterium]
MLEARGIVKRYPGVTALGGVDFSVGPGEVVALLGENGAGKSTMIKTLGGLQQPDEGEIVVDGQAVRIANAAHATKLGIGVIHQELNNLDNLDIAGNVFLGREPSKLGLIDRKRMVKDTRQYLSTLGLNVDPTTPLRQLSIAQQQMVEIAKALSLDAKYLIMDEPTSSLTAGETAKLLEVVADLRGRGVGIVYVSHRLDEVKICADRAVVFRDGNNAGGLSKEELTTENMVRLMVGRDVAREVGRPYVVREPRLVVEGLRTKRYPEYEISFTVGKGEIVGVAGLVGAGRTEVAQSIFGVHDRVAGTVTIDGEVVRSGSAKEAIQRGLFLAPEDRRHEGVLTTMTIRENITLPAMERYSSVGLIDRKRETTVSLDMRERLRIKAPTVESVVRGLSGGNQQKVVLAKWLSLEPKVIIFDEPTRGIDVGARSEIYALMRGLAEAGTAILMISSDMEEVLGLSDRIVVMREGRLTGTLTRDEASEEAVMQLAVAS